MSTDTHESSSVAAHIHAHDMEDIIREFNGKFPTCFSGVYDEQIDALRSQIAERLKESRVLGNNEHYVHFINYYRWVNAKYPIASWPTLSDDPSICQQNKLCEQNELNKQKQNKESLLPGRGHIDILIILGTITNMSNLTWIEMKCKLHESDENKNQTWMRCRSNDLNQPLNQMSIDTLSMIKSLSPQTFNGYDIKYKDPECPFKYFRSSLDIVTQSVRGLNIHNKCTSYEQGIDDNDYGNYYEDIYDLILRILMMNKIQNDLLKEIQVVKDTVEKDTVKKDTVTNICPTCIAKKKQIPSGVI